MSRAARAGVIVKGGDVLERLSRAQTFVFDKTGTLTGGTPELEEVRVRRTHQWISRDNGAREDPLPPDAETAPPVQEYERVS